MREHKYRAYDKDIEDGHMVYSDGRDKADRQVEYDFMIDEKGKLVCQWFEDYDDVYGDPRTNSGVLDNLMEFAGLRDKKGTEVYVDDICRDGNGKIGVVKSFGGTREMPNGLGGFEQFGLYTKLQDGSWEHFKRTSFVGLEVIGNIHENPNLLKGEGK